MDDLIEWRECLLPLKIQKTSHYFIAALFFWYWISVPAQRVSWLLVICVSLTSSLLSRYFRMMESCQNLSRSWWSTVTISLTKSTCLRTVSWQSITSKRKNGSTAASTQSAPQLHVKLTISVFQEQAPFCLSCDRTIQSDRDRDKDQQRQSNKDREKETEPLSLS